MAIDPLVIWAGAWAWDAFGKDVVGGMGKRLLRAAGIGGKKVAAETWEKFEWKKASEAYRRKMRDRYTACRCWASWTPSRSKASLPTCFCWTG